jgi:hypothetical protein
MARDAELFISQNFCCRKGQIGKEEEHICFACGYSIPTSTAERCPNCKLLVCPNCGSCFCTLSYFQKEMMLAIFSRYCCDKHNLKNFKKIDFKGDKIIKTNMEKNLKFCSKKI